MHFFVDVEVCRSLLGCQWIGVDRRFCRALTHLGLLTVTSDRSQIKILAKYHVHGGIDQSYMYEIFSTLLAFIHNCRGYPCRKLEIISGISGISRSKNWANLGQDLWTESTTMDEMRRHETMAKRAERNHRCLALRNDLLRRRCASWKDR